MSCFEPALPRKILDKTPYELLTKNKTNIKYFRVFGCKCFVLNKSTRLSKFESKTIEGIFVGYGSNSYTYRYYNPLSGRVEESINVEFDENNGSREEQVVQSVVGDEAPSQAIRSMGIGDLVPVEHGSFNKEGEARLTQAQPSTSLEDDHISQDELPNQEQVIDPQPNEQDKEDELAQEKDVVPSPTQAQDEEQDQFVISQEIQDGQGQAVQDSHANQRSPWSW